MLLVRGLQCQEQQQQEQEQGSNSSCSSSRGDYLLQWSKVPFKQHWQQMRQSHCNHTCAPHIRLERVALAQHLGRHVEGAACSVT